MAELRALVIELRAEVEVLRAEVGVMGEQPLNGAYVVTYAGLKP